MKSISQFPTIGIVIPAYNREDTIARAIESVIAQSFKNWKLVVIDDCSNDDTHKVACENAEKDERISVIRNDQNSGSNRSRNRGIEILATEWTAMLDSDDAWRPNHLEQLIERIYHFQYKLKAFRPKIAYSALEVHYLDESKKIFPALRFGNIQKILASKSFIRTACMMVHRDVFEKVGAFSLELNGADEYELLIRAVSANFKVANAPEVTVDVYIQPNRMHNPGKDFYHVFLTYKDFFESNLSPKQIGQRIDWTTNFARANGERLKCMYWYFRAFLYVKDFGMLKRSFSAPIYPELSWLRDKLNSKK